jgi:hypothetical protein
VVEIPIFQNDSSNFIQNITLNNKRVQLKLVYNVRSAKWVLYIAYDNFFLEGVPLVLNYPLIFRQRWLVNSLRGEFLCLQKNTKVENITYENLGVDVGLYFFTDAEYRQWSRTNGLG